MFRRTLIVMLMALCATAAGAEFSQIFHDGDPIEGADYVEGEYKAGPEGAFLDFSDQVWGNTSQVTVVYETLGDGGWHGVVGTLNRPAAGWDSDPTSRRFDFDPGEQFRAVEAWAEFNPSVSADAGSVSSLKSRF